MRIPRIGSSEAKRQSPLVQKHGFAFPAQTIKHKRGLQMNTGRLGTTFAELGEVSDRFGLPAAVEKGATVADLRTLRHHATFPLR